MSSIETWIGYATGVRLLAPRLSDEYFWPTLIVIHLLDAILCRVFARNNRYSENLWTLLGFIAGLWAVVCLLLLTRRQERQRSQAPPASGLRDNPG
ncbi:MAG: hypothetical protein N3C12_12005 [Candidatus Binatia bacterium]|nr:hypothetical protein [Candidatus Binatia bacterium]